MAGRSFKPASYLASATQAAPNRSPRQRPQFTRSSSASSVASTKSEDSVVGMLKSLVLEGREGKEDAAATTGPSIPDTPGRKRSQPIAIELPSRSHPKVYTPLSARGDLPGGYFPHHESPTTVTHKKNPFSLNPKTIYPESPTMSGATSLATSPSELPTHILTPNLLGPLSPTIPEPLLKPMGKYHPSNYKSPASTSVSTPTSHPSSSSAGMLPPTHLTIPTLQSKRKNKSQNPARSGHERKSSDVTRKLQQYQRDMIAQARISAQTSMNMSLSRSVAGAGQKKEPNSPRLLPCGSPGPITPLELEMDGEDGYLVAGARARGGSGGGLEQEERRGSAAV
ncbi:hypothetical protein L207DRAFT_175466 [Hyaloscypha variabilis F]|uniref:Uncharacterized protein n=1 Tax=Hyaloscypha variabilis (strain UAMH 11265 / GT02V1 / F) TaxID=1149755 RepID=A0A2J6R3L8_HYAVF|nr:hypothetical protein L207DRAFT_175466 [Hyaloscypha variabilis F]